MTTVIRLGRLRIVIYSETGQQHHSPHCHAYLNDAEAVFDITNFACLANNGFKKKALNQIQQLITDHQDELLDMWRLLNEEE